MDISELLQSLPRTLALRLTKLYLGTTKLRFLQKNSTELTEFSLNLDMIFQWELWFPYTTAFFRCTFYMAQHFIWCYKSQKKYNEDFRSPKNCIRLMTFSNFQEHTLPIFKKFKIIKLQDIIKFNTLKLIYLYYKD